MSPGASIVNMGSTVTIFGPAEASVYTASKGAIDALTRALSNELAPQGIRVNGIKPGVVDTPRVCRPAAFSPADSVTRSSQRRRWGVSGAPRTSPQPLSTWHQMRAPG